MPGGVYVVMATYNGSRFVDQQLRSLARQTELPVELVVSDDASTDDTVAIVEDFRRTAPFPVEVRRNARRLGYGENFLGATRLAGGDLVAFCDQDDVWYPDKLAVARRRLDETGADLFVHAADAVSETGARRGRFTQGISGDQVYEPLQLDPWSVFYGFSMVFRRTLLTLVDPARRGAHTFEHDRPLSHDLWVYFLATSLGRVAATDTPLAAYRQHGANVTPPVLQRSSRALSSSLGVAADPALARHDTARHRAALLAELSATAAEDRRRSAAARAARYWSRIAAYEQQRLGVYGADRLSRRASACGRLVLQGAYRRHRNGGLGPVLLVKDGLAGVVGLRRRGT